MRGLVCFTLMLFQSGPILLSDGSFLSFPFAIPMLSLLEH